MCWGGGDCDAVKFKWSYIIIKQMRKYMMVRFLASEKNKETKF